MEVIIPIAIYFAIWAIVIYCTVHFNKLVR